MLSRRNFLKSFPLVALAPTVPGFLARAARAAEPKRDGRVLVVLQLEGGNDGINTVVPFADEGYARYRKLLRLPKDQLVRLNDCLGLHPALRHLAPLYENGTLAVVQGVGYPNPNRSHFRSMAIWHSARFDPNEHEGPGWLGRALDTGLRPAAGSPASLFVGLEAPPAALLARYRSPTALAQLDDFLLALDRDPRQAMPEAGPGDDLTAFVRRNTLDAYATAGRMQEVVRAKDDGARYPASALAGRLRLIARLLKAGSGARIFYTLQGGYDTHSSQGPLHYALLAELAEALKAFFDDLSAAGLADRVALLTFSEFGRRVQENPSGDGGTDHGTAGPIFVAGQRVRGGLVGQTPSLMDLEDGDLKMTVDFRRVYAGVLENWLNLPSKAALAGSFEPLPLFRV
jgi:uncharacterized protein (DUF1501 family)